MNKLRPQQAAERGPAFPKAQPSITPRPISAPIGKPPRVGYPHSNLGGYLHKPKVKR